MKKNKHLCRIISMVLLLALLLQTVGCKKEQVEEQKVEIQPMEIEEVVTYGFDFLGGKDVMPIMAFFGPNFYNYSYNGNDMPEYVSDEMFQLYKETGINIIGKSQVDASHIKAKEILELGEKYGLGILVSDSRLNNTMTLEEADAYTKDYADYPAFIGCYVVDEPQGKGFYYTENSGKEIADFAHMFEILDQLGIFGHGNLFPSAMGSNSGYKSYIQRYLELCPVKILGYDMYPFKSADDPYGDVVAYWEDMTMIREGAEAAGIPFWPYVATGGQHNDAAKPFDSAEYFSTKGQFYWNVGTSLAFGAKGLQYFTLLQPGYYAYSATEPWDFQRNGLLGAWGNKTRWFHYAKAMNAQIAAVDEVLMNSVNKGVIASSELAKQHLGDSQYLMDGVSWRELSDVKGDALIGCFNYYGKTALYVVNYDVEYAQHITLDFVDKFNVSVVQDAEKSYVSGDSLTLTLSAGNSALVVFE